MIWEIFPQQQLPTHTRCTLSNPTLFSGSTRCKHDTHNMKKPDKKALFQNAKDELLEVYAYFYLSLHVRLSSLSRGISYATILTKIACEAVAARSTAEIRAVIRSIRWWRARSVLRRRRRRGHRSSSIA